jgi:hypothetical protein
MDKAAVQTIAFTPSELELLRTSAELALAFRVRMRIRSESWPEKRYEFVRDYMRGAEPATHEKQQRWLKRIKKECRAIIK